METALWSGVWGGGLIGGKILHLIQKRVPNKLLKLRNVRLMKQQHGNLAQMPHVTPPVEGYKYFPQRCVLLCGDNGNIHNKDNQTMSLLFFRM